MKKELHFFSEVQQNFGLANEGRVYALYSYSAIEQDELSFESGEELKVLKRGDATEKEWWWAANKEGETGYIPRNLLGVCDYAPTHPPSHLPTYPPTHSLIYLQDYPPTHLHTYPPTHSPTYLLTHLPTYLPTYLPIHLPTHLPTYPPTHPLTYLPIGLPTHPPNYLFRIELYFLIL